MGATDEVADLTVNIYLKIHTHELKIGNTKLKILCKIGVRFVPNIIMLLHSSRMVEQSTRLWFFMTDFQNIAKQDCWVVAVENNAYGSEEFLYWETSKKIGQISCQKEKSPHWP